MQGLSLEDLEQVSVLFESRARQNDDYEMVLRFDVDSTNDSDDLDNQPPIDIRERRLQLLEKQVKIVLLWVVYFYLQWVY